MYRALFLSVFTLLLSGCLTTPDSTPTQKTYTSFDGQTLAYIDRGEGPVVLMLHGLTSNADVNFGMTGLMEAAVKTGYRVIAPDLRGHGGSTVSPDAANWPVDAMAKDQIALLEVLDEAPAIVLGYSTGALVALRLQVLDAPASSMLLGGMGDKTAVLGDRARHDGIAVLLDQIAAGGTGPMAERIGTMLSLSGSSAEGVRGSLQHRMTVTQQDLAAMDIPVLILNGDSDFDNGDGAALAAMFPAARFDTVTGDHLTALRHPDYVKGVVNFLASENTRREFDTAARALIKTLDQQQTFAMLGWQANPAYQPLDHCFDYWHQAATTKLTSTEIEDCDGHIKDLSRLYASYGVEAVPALFKSEYYWDQRNIYLTGWESLVTAWEDAGGTEDDASYLSHPNCAVPLQKGWTGSDYFYDGAESPICKFYKIEAIENAQSDNVE